MKNKFKNIHTSVDGIKFDSKKEAERYKILCRMEQYGAISGLELQKKFEVLGAQSFNDKEYNERAVTYVADFYYFDNIRNCYVVEDVKGSKRNLRPEYIIKRKLFKKKFGESIRFVEVY